MNALLIQVSITVLAMQQQIIMVTHTHVQILLVLIHVIEVRVLWYQIMKIFGPMLMVVMDIKNGRTRMVIHGQLHPVAMEKSLSLVYNYQDKQEILMKARLH